MSDKVSIWLSYDLGLKGDYAALYTWLDDHEAAECGDSMAFLHFQVQNNLLEELEADIKQHIKQFNKTDRIYVIYKDNTTGDIKGKFIVGGRKRAPWQGYAIGWPSSNEDF